MSNPGGNMRVAVWYNNRDVRVEEMPVPKIGPGELLVRIEASLKMLEINISDLVELDR